MALQKIGRKFTKAEPDEPPFRFCVVRHPLSWYESWWKYMKGRGWNDWGTQNSADDWHPNSVLNGQGSDDFNTFIRNVIRARPGYVSELYFSFTKPGISYIGKTESLTDDITTVLEALGLPFDRESVRRTPKANVSKTPPEEVRWDEELRQTVIRLELPAMIHFGYLDAAAMREFGVGEEIKPNPALHADLANAHA